LRAFAASAEQNVTPDLQTIAEALNGRMVGLDARLKSVDSLTRKLEDFPGRSINDALRYTMSFETEDFSGGVRGAMDAMDQNGYQLVRMSNTFKAGVPYKGINATYRTAEGQEFELQFHTPESFYMKDVVNHPLYEQQRVLEEFSPEWNLLKQQMIENSNTVMNPPGVNQIKPPKKW
jgi:hypothetical protein